MTVIRSSNRPKTPNPKATGKPVAKVAPPPESARALAVKALTLIEQDGAYANIALPQLLGASDLDQRDRGFVTEMVYGTTRMRRALDFAAERFLTKQPPAPLRTLLRLGAYQILYMNVPVHAAVGETVSLAPTKFKPVVNAVLRRISTAPPIWPDVATELSYPDWIVDRFVEEMGESDAYQALDRMNLPAPVTTRDDGYVQDRSSTWVADLVEAGPNDLVLDLCAAPGGKATRLADTAGFVVAADRQAHRAKLVSANIRRLDQRNISVVVADATEPAFPEGSFDRVLLDAPCSGLGALRRRADARWRMTSSGVDELVALQRRMLDVARTLVKPGGVLVYSVCTITAAESIDHDDGSWPALPAPGDPWRPFGRGGRLLPHDDDTDGMTIIRWLRP
jgi:16S rRNA (cytosine967-C5)-methyltransferase